jgi:ketosteroid isomerase-like protein
MVKEAIAAKNPDSPRQQPTATRAMASVYADDADLLPANAQPLRGLAAIERFWHGGIEMGIRGLGLETLRLEQARRPRSRCSGGAGEGCTACCPAVP